MIETQRLILRPFKREDAADLYEYLKEPSVHCFASMKLDSVEQAAEMLRERENNNQYCFAIVLKENGRVIGEVEAYPEAATREEGAAQDTFSPCWMLNKDYQGKGYAFEAVSAFFDYLFTRLGARRVYAYTEDYNIHSQRLCEKLGMRREGAFREFVSFVNAPDGTPIYENTIQYAILRREWLKED